MKEIEIEKKYKVKKLPEHLEQYDSILIEQSYLNRDIPALRLRKFTKKDGTFCFLSKKHKVTEDSFEFIEHNIELPLKIYQDLLEAIEGRTIHKTRYIIPIEDGLKIELDCFHGILEGVCIAEIEFQSKEQASTIRLPEWVGEDVTDCKILANSYIAREAKNIHEYQEFLVK